MLSKLRNKSWNLAGFKVTIDPFLIIIVVILTWLLSTRYYPRFSYRPHELIYWVMGIITALALTFSILLHELGHAFTAKRLHIPIERIHLFLFGGMAELRHRPIEPKDELSVAISGPIVSLLFALICYYASNSLEYVQPESFLVLRNIALMNALLGGFNLIPIFPLDGGRALRALLWLYQKRYRKASRFTYIIGKQIIAILFIVALLSYFLYNSQVTIWLGLFSIYMIYTVMSGRKELVYIPELNDLILEVEENASPLTIVEILDSTNKNYLKKSIIPVIDKNEVKYILYGRDLDDANHESPVYDDFLQPVEPGTFVDVEKVDTYHPEIAFKADYLPVFHNGVLQGMCDAHEMRFWLLERYKTINIS